MTIEQPTTVAEPLLVKSLTGMDGMGYDLHFTSRNRAEMYEYDPEFLSDKIHVLTLDPSQLRGANFSIDPAHVHRGTTIDWLTLSMRMKITLPFGADRFLQEVGTANSWVARHTPFDCSWCGDAEGKDPALFTQWLSGVDGSSYKFELKAYNKMHVYQFSNGEERQFMGFNPLRITVTGPENSWWSPDDKDGIRIGVSGEQAPYLRIPVDYADFAPLILAAKDIICDPEFKIPADITSVERETVRNHWQFSKKTERSLES